MIIIKILCGADGSKTNVDGCYVKAFDADARAGRGFLAATRNPLEALLFPDHTSAHNFWRTQSTKFPFRPDGKPNRPLTAYNIELLML